MNINFYGQPAGWSGPAEHCKGICRALKNEGFNVSLCTPQKDNIEADIIPMVQRPKFSEAVTLTLDPPLHWWQFMAERREALIGLIVFEGDRIPYEWAEAIRQPEINQIWVPSNHVKEAVKNRLLEFDDVGDEVLDKIEIVPHGVDTEMFSPKGKKMDFGDNYFTFGFVGGWSQGLKDRKGLDLAYRAFASEFRKNEKAKFIFKLTNIYNKPNYKPLRILKRLKVPKNHAPMAGIFKDNPNKATLATIYRAADVLVYPSKAEAFGFTAAEAMACGAPVIASSYGGQLDFVNTKNGWLIETEKMIDATDEHYWYSDTRWALPSVKDLQKKMRYCFDNQDEVRKKSKIARRMIVDNFQWKNTGVKAKSLINKLIH